MQFRFPDTASSSLTSHADHDPDQECAESVAFIKGRHQWCGREMIWQPGNHHLDRVARGMLDAMLRVICDYIAENPVLNPHVAQKLSFVDSVPGRLVRAIVRLCPYAERLVPFAVSSTAKRLEWNCRERVYAAYSWRRQLVFQLSSCPCCSLSG